jgi:predicted MFS family arabinose efflux permease
MSAREEWRQHWTVVAASAAGMLMIAILPYAFGAFVLPLQTAFGWSRTDIVLGMSIGGPMVALTGPLVGYAADRLGVRRIALCGTVVQCLAMAGLSQVGPDIKSYWGAYLLVAVGGCLCSTLIWTRAVASWFVESRGTALAFAVSGATIASLTAPVVATFLIQHWGWRAAYLTLAAVMFTITFPTLLAFFYDADDQRKKAATEQTAPRAISGLTTREVLRSAPFWIIAASAILGGGATMSIHAHLIPLLHDHGLDPMYAATGMSLVGIGAVAGRLGGGYLLDRISAATVAALTFGPPVIGCVVLVTVPASTGMLLTISAVFGLAAGVEFSLLPFITARYFGLRSYGTIYGIINGAFSVGGSSVPPFLGYLYGRQGNYNGGLMIMALFFFLAAGVLQLLRPPAALTTPDALSEVA